MAANPIGFTRAVLRALWDGYDLDGQDIQELALKHEVIVRTKFDPTKHTDHQGVGARPGDEWFVPARLPIGTTERQPVIREDQ